MTVQSETVSTISAEERLKLYITARIESRFAEKNIEYTYSQSEPFTSELVRSIDGTFIVNIGQIISEYKYIGEQTYPLKTIITDIIDQIRSSI